MGFTWAWDSAEGTRGERTPGPSIPELSRLVLGELSGNNHGTETGAHPRPRLGWKPEKSIGQCIQSQGGRVLLGPEAKVFNARGFTVQGS